jgi:hypothetical protein
LSIDNMLTCMSATTWKQKQVNTPPTHSNHSQLFHNSNRQQYGYVHHSLFCINMAFSAEYTLSKTNVILI